MDKRIMNYELAKQLKESRFNKIEFGFNELDEIIVEEYSIPTLEELIEACGDRFGELCRMGDLWEASHNGGSIEYSYIETSETPSEAVANLWLKLQKSDTETKKIYGKAKVVRAGRGLRVEFNCDYCGAESYDRKSHYDRKEKHYCNNVCYGRDMTENWDFSNKGFK